MKLARLLLAAALVTGCAAPASEPGEPTIDPRVTVLPAISGMIVEPNSITIPRDGNGAVAGLAKGDIVISTHGEGFLRQIESIAMSADTITLATIDAELTDALIEAQLTTSVGGEGKADTHQLPSIGFEVANKRVLDNPAITATLSASLSFSPELDLDLDISNSRLELFEMVLRGRIRGTIDLTIDARDAAVGPEIRLWESPPAIFYQQLGILPVVETVTTSVVLKVQATARGQGRVRIDAEALATMAGGIRYTSAEGWDGIADFDFSSSGSVSETALTFEQLGVRVWLAARADVRLYGLAGPFVAAGPQAGVWRDLGDGHIGGEVGFRSAAGGGLKFLRLNVPTVPTLDLFDLNRPLL